MERDCHLLYAHKDTFFCATKHGCVCCFYKLCPLGGRSLPPNLRPETCPRSKLSEFPSGLYPKDYPQTILTVGDGDFSFSLSLAQGLGSRLDSKSTIVATSHETETSVTTVYPGAASNIREIGELGGRVFHEVDAANLQASSSMSAFTGRFDHVVWNFPCKSMKSGADAQVEEIEENQVLLTQFFESVRELLKPGDDSRGPGQIHVTHKTFEPFCWWGIIKLAEAVGLHYEGSVVFDRYLYPGYINKKALDNKSFPFHDAQTYVFSNRLGSAANSDGTLRSNPNLIRLDQLTYSNTVFPSMDEHFSTSKKLDRPPKKKRRKT